MSVAGAIASRVRGILPVTWDALEGDTRYGDALLQSTIDTCKELVFGTVVTPSAESSYPLIVIDYVAKIIALELINPGIDYWMTQPIGVSATGTNENNSFTDYVAALKDLRAALLEETRKLLPIVQPLIPYVRVTSSSRMAINTRNDEFLTPSPQEFPRPYRTTTFS